MMLSMFLVWIVVFALAFLRPRFVPPVALIAMGWTLFLLSAHISDPIPLNF
jgi:hypothetical protein